jgi:HlyD family secretion protein
MPETDHYSELPNSSETSAEIIQFPDLQASTEDWSYATKELIDTLPKVWSRGLLYFLVIFVSIILPWAMLAKVDETGVAQGRLEPKGKTIRLDAPVSGTIASINIKEGDEVKADQNLVEFETTLVKADIQQQKTKLEGQESRLNQLKILQNQLQVVLQTQKQQNISQELEKMAQVNQAQQNLTSLQKTYELQKEEKQAQVNQAKQNLEASKTSHQLAEISLATAQREVERYREAANEGIVPQIQLVEKEDAVQEKKKIYEQTKSDIIQAQLRLDEENMSYQRTLRQSKSDIEQAELRLKEQQNSYNSLVSAGEISVFKIQEQLRNIETDITTLKSEIKQSKSQIQSLQFELNQRLIKSPVEGIIFDISIDQKGAVLQTGSKIIEIAPKGTPLILKAHMPTTESGSLTKGMPVKLKFDAYPFQDYGIIEGELSKISPTTKELDTPNGKVLAYELEITLDQTCMPSNNECIPLRPGDTATAEVIVRKRRIIDFVLDPFKQLNKGGFKL